MAFDLLACLQSYKPFKGVKYMTVGGDYQVGLACGGHPSLSHAMLTMIDSDLVLYSFVYGKAFYNLDSWHWSQDS